MDARILSIGTELTTGQTVDTNAAWLSAELTALGVRVVGHQTVGDDVEPIRQALARGLAESNLVIATGGLGPTPDDLTRRAISLAIDQPLEENPEAIRRMEEFFQRWQREMSASNRVQAQIPRGCDVIPNEHGTAPGIHYERENVQLFALPGVPEEMKRMFAAAVVPFVKERTGDTCVRVARLQSFGLSEARIGELLADMMSRERNPLVGTAASKAVISVRILARAGTHDEARRLIDRDVEEVRRRVGRAVFGEEDDELESAVADLLKKHSLTLATAESCTGGLLAKRVTDIPGSSEYFRCGYVTYSNEAKTDLLGVSSDLIAAHGAVSEPTARAMASGCRTAARSDIALSITGIAGPGGGDAPDKPVGLVYIGLATSDGVEVKRLLLGEHLRRNEVRCRACSFALNLLRLRLLEVDTKESGPGTAT